MEEVLLTGREPSHRLHKVLLARPTSALKWTLIVHRKLQKREANSTRQNINIVNCYYTFLNDLTPYGILFGANQSKKYNYNLKLY